MTIRAAATTAQKLGVREGSVLLLIGAPEGWSLGPLPAAATLMAGASAVAVPERKADLAVLFASDTASLEASLEDALKAVPLDGLFWIAYRKGGAKAGTDLNRDILQARLSSHGMVGVTLIALDEIWSGMRVRPVTHVGRR
jgi:hypothetical protein